MSSKINLISKSIHQSSLLPDVISEIVAEHVGEFSHFKVTLVNSRLNELRNFCAYGQHIYLVFQNHIEKFDLDGNFIGQYNGMNISYVAISGPLVYICEPERRFINVINESCKYQPAIESIYPNRCFAYRNRLYVSNGFSRVTVFDTVSNQELFSFDTKHTSLQGMSFIGDTIYILSTLREWGIKDQPKIQMFDMNGILIHEECYSIEERVGSHYTYSMATFEDKIIIIHARSTKLFVFSPKLDFIKSVDIGIVIVDICSDEHHLYLLTDQNKVLTF